MPTQKKFRDSIHAKGTEIAVLSTGDANDYISLTDIARYKSDAPDDVIKNWMRNRDTIEFLGLWEQLNNPDFKSVEFDGFRTQAGSNAFTMSPKKWIEATRADVQLVARQAIKWDPHVLQFCGVDRGRHSKPTISKPLIFSHP